MKIEATRTGFFNREKRKAQLSSDFFKSAKSAMTTITRKTLEKLKYINKKPSGEVTTQTLSNSDNTICNEQMFNQTIIFTCTLALKGS